MELYNYYWLLHFKSFGIINNETKIKHSLPEIMKCSGSWIQKNTSDKHTGFSYFLYDMSSMNSTTVYAFLWQSNMEIVTLFLTSSNILRRKHSATNLGSLKFSFLA